MKLFILEDDGNCNSIINWLKERTDTIKVVKNIEDAAYFLEYETDYKNYDKFILDASLPGAAILHLNGSEVPYNGALNGIDFMLDLFPDLGIELNADRVAILTAFTTRAKEYLSAKNILDPINIIDKNDNDLTKKLLEFLSS